MHGTSLLSTPGQFESLLLPKVRKSEDKFLLLLKIIQLQLQSSMKQKSGNIFCLIVMPAPLKMFQVVMNPGVYYLKIQWTLEGLNICLRCLDKMISFSQLPAVKKTSFCLGISNKYWVLLISLQLNLIMQWTPKPIRFQYPFVSSVCFDVSAGAIMWREFFGHFLGLTSLRVRTADYSIIIVHHWFNLSS